ncbi:MAG TPA: Ig-like domain-containing domain [Cyclobacteriaceae bacterium]|nr:Ig-like domain-containing domain [Cyclobacteriaceae bacterium]
MSKHAYYLFALIFFAGCASLTSPNGGPKDKEPPLLLSSTPKNKQTHVTATTITLTFDEPIKLNNPREEILISPSPGKGIEYKAKGNSVVITFKKPLKDSTTYNIQFRDGIQDLTESNVPPDLNLSFSTGDYLDSMYVTGNVFDILKAKRLEKVSVALYDKPALNNDHPNGFNIFNDTAVYTTKTNKKGAFRFNNIRRGTYSIYAFDDKNKNLKVESNTERYGFRATPIQLTKPADSISIGVFIVDTRKLKITSVRNIGHLTRVRFSKLLDEYEIKPDSNVIHSFGDQHNEINIWNPEETGDTIRFILSAKDSVSAKIDTAIYITRTNVKAPKDGFTWDLGKPIIEAETGNFSTTINFNKPILNINPDSLYLKIDTIAIIPFTSKNFTPQPKSNKLVATTNLDIKYFQAKKEPTLSLIAGKQFAVSVDNDTTKRITTSIPIIWSEDTGIIHVQVETRESNYIIQLLDRQGKIIASTMNTTRFTFRNVTPQDYQIRMIVDLNKNGRWDNGIISTNTEPEPIYYYRTPKNSTYFTMRANWENGPLILKF